MRLSKSLTVSRALLWKKGTPLKLPTNAEKKDLTTFTDLAW